MTGLFEGKNVIVIMMESMDELAVSEQNTPTIYRMMQEGINFTIIMLPFLETGPPFPTSLL